MSKQVHVAENNPRLGVITDTEQLQGLVSDTLVSAGFQVSCNLAVASLAMQSVPRVDLWVIEIADQDRWVDTTMPLIEQETVPVLVGAGRPPQTSALSYPRWQRLLCSKVIELVGLPANSRAVVSEADLQPANEMAAEPFQLPPALHQYNSYNPNPVAKHIWVLGASMGGPNAVKAFLDVLPAGLPIAFVIAQHIDAGFSKTLQQVWGRQTAFEFIDPEDGLQLKQGQIFIAPVEHLVRINEHAGIEVLSEHWFGPYSPSIDQMMHMMVDTFGARTGAILFSGMGNDGAIAGLRLARVGAPVWAQSAESCVCSSMPDSARETGCVSFSGSPKELAAKLIEQVKTFVEQDPARQRSVQNG